MTEAEWSDQTYFVGCTCPHEPEAHGWGDCDAVVFVAWGVVISCPCPGGWEE